MPPAMENSSRSSKYSLRRPSSQHRRSGYEPSDTETEWQESPWHGGLLISNRSKTPNPVRTITTISNRSTTPEPMGSISPSNSIQRNTSKEDNEDFAKKSSRGSPGIRRHSRSPYKPIRHGDAAAAYMAHPCLKRNTSPFNVPEHRSSSPYKVSEHQSTSPIKMSEHRNASPFKVSDHQSKHLSSYRARREGQGHETNEVDGSSRRQNQKTLRRQCSDDKGAPSRLQEGSSVSERSPKEFEEISRVRERYNYNQNRSMSAPKLRAAPVAERRPLPLAKTMIHEESEGYNTQNHTPDDINERIANMKLAKSPTANALLMQSTESVSLSDIFISRDCTVLQKESVVKKSDKGNKLAQPAKTILEQNNVTNQFSQGTGSFNQNLQGVSIISTILSQTNTSSSSAFGRYSNGRSSTFSSKLSDSSGKLGGSFKRMTAIRQRNQTDTWLSCVRGGGSCGKAKSPDSKAVDEASFIERAFVVEELRPFWADKHSPRSLSKFICHKQDAQLLKQLISQNDCPHILFKGPSGSGKKSLSKGLLYETFGDSWKTSDDLRYFHVQENGPMQIAVPITSSPHHVELNLKYESKNVRYALMGIVKEITENRALVPDVSDVSFKADYKVIILYNVDKVADSVQHLIKWIMDRHTDACKIILCCEDDADILDPVKSRCKLITVDAPVTHDIMEVLIQIAKKENFELSVSFAARIASKSKQNLRKAIMALEACKAHNYPFVDEQPIPLGWEEVVVEVSAEILADPSTKRLFLVRGRFQKLLVEFVHPKLILHKLVEQFLKHVEAGIKRELYYWHSYYDKRLPIGTSALLKLEEFVAKFMSIYRKSRTTSGQQVV